MLILNCNTIIEYFGLFCGFLVLLYALLNIIYACIELWKLHTEDFVFEDDKYIIKKTSNILYSEAIDGKIITVSEKELDPDYELEKQIMDLKQKRRTNNEVHSM